MAQTLEELKAANAEAEAAAEDENVSEEIEDESSPQEEESQDETETVEEEADSTEEVAETEAESAEESDAEDWMQSDEPKSQAEKKFTDGDIGKAKAKLKAKLADRNSEIEKLKAELEAAKASSPKTDKLVKPKREDFYESEDPDGDYMDALTDYKIQVNQAEQQARSASEATARQQQEQALEIAKSVDQHYERAVELSAKSGISAEQYQSADRVFREMVESIYPQAGDAIADALISNMGKGSEKVVYNLGVNATKRAELKALLEADKAGLKASIYLGKLTEQLASPSKRKTNAPAPAKTTKGDATENASLKALKKKYDAAHKSGNDQEAFNLRRKARAKGANVNEW